MSAPATTSRLAVELAGQSLQNPLFLASGTAGYGRELDGILDIDSLGGIVTKAVSIEPRAGAAAPRVAEFPSGMINAVGLANPGVDEFLADHLPWLAARVHSARVLVNVVGSRLEHFAEVVGRVNGAAGVHGFELNVSCPNVRAGGTEFGADNDALRELVRRARDATRLPIFVKLSPTLPDIARTASVALDAGANGLTLVNTMPPGSCRSVERNISGKNFGSAPNTSCPEYCSNIDTPIAVISALMRGARRSGRYAKRSTTAPRIAAAAIDITLTAIAPPTEGSLFNPSQCPK